MAITPSLPVRDPQPPRMSALVAKTKLIVRHYSMTVPSEHYQSLIKRIHTLEQANVELTALNTRLEAANSDVQIELDELVDMIIELEDDDSMDESA